MLFINENFLFMLIIPLILFFLSVKPRQSNIHKLFSKSVLEQLSVQQHRLYPSARYRLLLLSIVLFILALSRPVSDAKILSKQQGLTPLIIAIDMSKSMYAKDVYPNRLSLAKEKAKSLISNAFDMRIGLILFAKNAYIAYPLSEDLDALEYTLNHLNFTKKFEVNSNIFAALEGANHMLRTYENKNILLLSDGGSSDDFNQEINYLKENNITLHTISIATQKGAIIPQTHIQYSKQNPELKSLADESGGHYQDYTWGNHDIKAVLTHIKERSLNPTLQSSQFKHYRELFSYPLALAVFLLFVIYASPFILFKKANLSLVLMFFSLVLFQTKAQANILDFKTIKEAKALYKNEKYLESAKLFTLLHPNSQRDYNLANALYKAEKYKQALAFYKKSLSKNADFNAKVYHNIGNTYFKLKTLAEAKKYYTKSLKISNNPLTQENLDITIQVIKNIKKKKREKPIPLKGMGKGSTLGRESFTEAPSSDYEVKIENIVLSQEQKWMKLLQEQQSMIFLQKLETKRVSKDAAQAW